MMAEPDTKQNRNELVGGALRAGKSEPDLLFYWIPKCAGTSLWNVLTRFSHHGLLKTRKRYTGFDNRGVVSFGHYNIQDLVDDGVVEQAYLEKAFKCCFVRNPWDRLVSLYSYYSKHDKVTSDFEGFCLKLGKRRILGLGLKIPRVGMYHTQDFNQANCQLDWIPKKDNHLLVDFVGRFENIADDFARLCELTGIEGELPALNRTDHAAYREYYTTKTADIVAQYYRRDIEAFGYEF
jgi:hypothetical protein